MVQEGDPEKDVVLILGSLDQRSQPVDLCAGSLEIADVELLCRDLPGAIGLQFHAVDVHGLGEQPGVEGLELLASRSRPVGESVPQRLEGYLDRLLPAFVVQPLRWLECGGQLIFGDILLYAVEAGPFRGCGGGCVGSGPRTDVEEDRQENDVVHEISRGLEGVAFV